MTQLWKKRSLTALWLAVLAGGLVLLFTSVRKKDDQLCKDVKIELSGNANTFFIDEREIAGILNATGVLVERKVSDINLQLLEQRLEKDTWIANAELFFDKNNILNVKVEEREPVARVFTLAGMSYYIDSTCHRLPLSSRISLRVPMFTSFPSDAKKLRQVDSVLLASVKDLAVFIRGSMFWNAQVAQIDITPDRTLEMIPVIGNHTVVLGRPVDYKEKFARLFTFYKQVWPKVGLEKYSRIDVQYNGQVVAVRRGTSSGLVDSVQARKAFEELMKESRAMQQENNGENVNSGPAENDSNFNHAAAVHENEHQQQETREAARTPVKRVLVKGKVKKKARAVMAGR